MAYDAINPPAERKILTYLAHFLWIMVNRDRPKGAEFIPYRACVLDVPKKRKHKAADMTDEQMLNMLRTLYKDNDDGNHSQTSNSV